MPTDERITELIQEVNQEIEEYIQKQTRIKGILENERRKIDEETSK